MPDPAVGSLLARHHQRALPRDPPWSFSVRKYGAVSAESNFVGGQHRPPFPSRNRSQQRLGAWLVPQLGPEIEQHQAIPERAAEPSKHERLVAERRSVHVAGAWTALGGEDAILAAQPQQLFVQMQDGRVLPSLLPV